jgi:hypothetical protein
LRGAFAIFAQTAASIVAGMMSWSDILETKTTPLKERAWLGRALIQEVSAWIRAMHYNAATFVLLGLTGYSDAIRRRARMSIA